MASAQVKRRQEAGRRKLEEFRKQKAEREKKASQNNNTAQPVDNTVADSDGEVAAASISNGPLSQSPETSSFNQTQSKSSSSSSGDLYDGSSKERSKRDESVGTFSSLDLRGSSNDFTVNNREKQSSGDFNRASTLTELIISSRKDSRQPTTQESGGSSIVQKPTLSNSYLFSSPDTSSRPSESSDDYGATSYSAKNEATVKRNRPSFLDSLNISRASEIPETSSGSQLTVGGPSPLQYISGKSDRSDSPYPYDSFRSPSFPVANGVMPGFADYSIPKQNDDFSSLEQVMYLFLVDMLFNSCKVIYLISLSGN
ncbi:hypothetical protein DY000_02022673 [Brassica cretica]|uniref:IBB domain-containing protein n=1 Tax=Brassica cretica TaxID=69181 RepID=A0ABQ7E1P4_BRACR|nr:hypothetical protein DY000_02022673 [Brassica cretica]